MKENHKQQIIKAVAALTVITPFIDIQYGIYFGILTIALSSVIQFQKPLQSKLPSTELLNEKTEEPIRPIID